MRQGLQPHSKHVTQVHLATISNAVQNILCLVQVDGFWRQWLLLFLFLKETWHAIEPLTRKMPRL